jgi:hypothetical protein
MIRLYDLHKKESDKRPMHVPTTITADPAKRGYITFV